MEDVAISNKNIKKMKFLRKIKNGVAIPDMYYGWAKKASRYGIKLMKKECFNVIFSMHEPPSSHLCAYRIKKTYRNVPWITYWSDPWLKDSTREKPFIIKQVIEKKMEKSIVRLADKFVFVTEANREDYINSYGLDKEKTYIITRGFDSKFFETLKKEEKPNLINNKKINIVYAGEIFSKLRNINPFIEALEEIKLENPELYYKINLMFFGNIDDVEAKEKLQSLEIASVCQRIPFNEAIKYMLHSEILMLFGNKNSKQIPAKIYEYFGARGKIFVVYGDELDPIKNLVEESNRCVTTLNEKKLIKDNLVKLLAEEKKELLSEPDYSYEWESIVERLNRILEV
jgi:glycosyltransferase involved in cell wall biosynthesis